MALKTSFSLKRKRPVDAAKARAFLAASALDDAIRDLDYVDDWLNPTKPKSQKIALEDATSKKKRLKKEGITHAEAGRFWEAIKKWNEALELNSSFSSSSSSSLCHKHLLQSIHGEEKANKPENCEDKTENPTSESKTSGISPKVEWNSNGHARIDAELNEMKAQALLELGEVYPAVQAAEAAVMSDPTWHVTWQTLGRTQMGFGEIKLAITSFSKAIHLKPDDEDVWTEDLRWAQKLEKEEEKRIEEGKAKRQQQPPTEQQQQQEEENKNEETETEEKRQEQQQQLLNCFTIN